MLGILALQDAGYILASYAITFAAIGAFTWRVMRGGRRLSGRIDDNDKYWT